MNRWFIFFFLIFLFVSPESQASAQSSYSIYFPTVSVSGITITLTQDDLYLGGCWTGWDRCVYVLKRALFDQIQDEQVGSVILNDQVYYKVEVYNFDNDEEFEDFLWSAEGTGVWIQGLGSRQALLLR
jgi:hypothetical protein